MKFTIPETTVQAPDGPLYAFYYNLILGRSDLKTSVSEGVVTVEGELILTNMEIYNITENGGEIYEYLAAIKANIGLLGEIVAEGLPNRFVLNESAISEVSLFKYWFEKGNTMYRKDDGTEIFFLTNPFGTSSAEYLKGSELRTLTAIPGLSVGIYTIEQFNAEIASGWTLVDLN